MESSLYKLVEDETVDLFKDELDCIVLSDDQVFVPVSTYKYLTKQHYKQQKQNPQMIFESTVSISKTVTKFESKNITRQSKIKEQQSRNI
jgi:hypothetical protein